MIANRTLRIGGWLLAAVFCALILLSLLVVAKGMNDEIHKADVAVVLGNAVNRDGLPSHRLAARLDTAVKLYRDGMFEHVIVSGGIGLYGFDEAVVMKNYLVKQGVPQDKIIADSFGVNTAATARNTAAIASEHRWSSVLVISQYFHIPRSRLALSRAGLDRVYSAHAHYFELRDIYSTLREVIGYAAYLAGARD